MRVITTGARRRVLVLAAMSAVAVLSLLTVTATRAPAQTTSSSTTTTTLGPPELLGGVTVEGAVVKTPGKPDRKLDANQATAFMQAWLPDSVFNTGIPQSAYPAGVPRSTLVVTTRWQNQDIPMTVYFAQQGENAWVGMPGPQNFGWALVQQDRSIQAPQGKKLIQAFEGKLQPIRSQPAPPTTTTTIAPKKDSSSSSNALPLILGGVAVVVVGGGAAWLISRGDRSPSPTSAPDDTRAARAASRYGRPLGNAELALARGAREVRTRQKAKEAPLDDVLRYDVEATVQHDRHRSDAATTALANLRVSSRYVLGENERVTFGAVECLLDTLPRPHRAEVDERPGRCRDRDHTDDCAIGRRQIERLMDDDVRMLVAHTPGNRDLDEAGARAVEAVQGGCSAVGSDALVSAAQARRKHALMPRSLGALDPVDAPR